MGLRNWTTAIVCSAMLTGRLPPRESRCRTLSPEVASIGAVPVQDAKWPVAVDRVMSPTSTSSLAAPEGPVPCRSSSLVPVALISSTSSVFAG